MEFNLRGPRWPSNDEVKLSAGRTGAQRRTAGMGKEKYLRLDWPQLASKALEEAENLIGARTVRRLIGGGLVLASAGCGDGPTGPEAAPAPPPDVRAYVTGAARENLDANGHFRLLPATVEGPYPIISAQDAEAIALGVIRTWYANPEATTLPGTTSLVEVAEREHGARIDWQAVRGGDHGGYFAESHLVPVPDSLGNPSIRHYGPQFLVPLYVEATPVVVVGVAAYATNIALDEYGFVGWTDNLDGGGEFTVTGIPLILDGTTVPPAPEVAVEFAFTETGVKISDVPVLGVPGNRVVRTLARWRLRLAEPVEFERVVDGRFVVTQDVYVGLFQSIADTRMDDGATSSAPHLRMYVAAETQPTEEEVGSVPVPLRPGYAVDLHEARVRE